ncbi:MAG: S41 family peptidase [Chloroflexi bacterium]|nr:S41 family peptidase [Chloroflexota bacterium]
MSVQKNTFWPPFSKSKWVLGTLLLAVVFFLGTLIGGQTQIGSAQENDLQNFLAPIGQLYNIIVDSFYGEPPDDPEALDAALEAIMESLNDRHSVYIEPEIFAITASDLSGELQGIGARVSTDEESGDVRIVSVLNGTPAQDAGLRSGDIFRVVDGIDVSTLNQSELVLKVRGLAGTTVNLTMQRGEELLDFVVKRARIIIPSVESELLDNDIGYLKLQDFSSIAMDQLDDALTNLNVRLLNALVLDLRDNPGGLLQSALDITSVFLAPGEVILYEVFADGEEEVFRADGNYAGLNIPIVILVNENSASASELFAAALQENEVATIIGEVTYGKGSVQTQHLLSNGGGVRVTIAEWLTPQRNSIEGSGIQPDIFVEMDETAVLEEAAADVQLDAALNYLAKLLRKAA